MPVYRTNDRVEATRDIVRRDRTFHSGHRGRVVADSPADIVIVRVKFEGDTATNFRIVVKSQIRRA